MNHNEAPSSLLDKAAPTRPASTSTDVSTYSRDALDKDLLDGFRKQQRAAKERQVEHLALAKGLGDLAVASLKDGYYNPRKVLPPLKPEEKKMFERMDFKDWRTGREVNNVGLEDKTVDKAALATATAQSSAFSNVAPSKSAQTVEGEGERQGSAAARPASASLTMSTCEELKENCPGAVRNFLQQLRSTSRATTTLHGSRVEVEDNIGIVEAALSHQCAPLSFATLLNAISRALEVMERGYLNEELAVPDCGRDVEKADGNSSPQAEVKNEEDGEKVRTDTGKESAAPVSPDTAPASSTADVPMVVLHGAVEVEAYTRQYLLPMAYRAIAIAHSAEWMLQYTMAFLRTIEAEDAAEAQLRLVLLGRCVRLLGDTESFSSVLLSLEAKSEEYAGFAALKDTAETHLGTLLDEVESSLDAVLGLPFPARRSRLLLIERGVQKKLQRALLFLNEIDYSWTPTAHFHWAWKAHFLSQTFQRIHGTIAHKYMRCSMGFVDDTLYDQVADTRITGRYMGASPIQPKVSRAKQVEYERVTEGLTLQQIGMSVKGVASLVVGEQVCMGARYILRQSTKAFDAAWGFHMDEISHAPTEDDLQKKVAKLAAKAKRQYVGRQGKDRTQPSATFLTQDE